ncbi:MAG: regulatory protein RecX [Gammaproteobacteria bacterium]|nr:regulatory protein RecX [Gammaproteobacteria bacterium]
MSTDRAALRAQAVKLLARREHSARELAVKLEARGYPAADVADTLAALAGKSLLSDERFCESYVHHRVARGYGPLRICHELRQRGVDGALIEQVFGELDVDWAQQLAQVRRGKFGAALPVGMREQARQGRFLQQRGFSTDAIRRLFRSGNTE